MLKKIFLIAVLFSVVCFGQQYKSVHTGRHIDSVISVINLHSILSSDPEYIYLNPNQRMLNLTCRIKRGEGLPRIVLGSDSTITNASFPEQTSVTYPALSVAKGTIHIGSGGLASGYDGMNALVIGNNNDVSSFGGTFNASDRSWLYNYKESIYSLNGLRTDGIIYSEGTGTNYFAGDVTAKTFNGVKKYVAILTQSGTGNPTANVLENSIGNIVWTRQDVGYYKGTLTNAFTTNKTVYSGNTIVTTDDPYQMVVITFYWENTNTIAIYTKTFSTESPTDGLLVPEGSPKIEINVYP